MKKIMWTVVIIQDWRLESFCRGIFRTRREAKECANRARIEGWLNARVIKLYQ
jgi:hypothetical protein